MTAKFPQSAMVGPFEQFREACASREDYSDEALHAVLMNNFSSVLGRRIFLEDDPPVFPNLYTVIVGSTGDARKSQVTKLGKAILKVSDETVIRQTALATAPGLINLFVFPNLLHPGSEMPEEYGQTFDDLDKDKKRGIGRHFETFTDRLKNMILNTFAEEGFRMQLVQNELSSLLKKAASANGLGIIEAITEFYDMEDEVTSPTKTDPTTAHFPCLNIIGTTTKSWIEKNIEISDIHGGFINRFCFYESNPDYVEDPFPAPIDRATIVKICKQLASIRSKWVWTPLSPEVGEASEKGLQQAFTVSEEAKGFMRTWIKPKRAMLKELGDEVSESSKRYSLHAKKLALIYAAITNNEDDNAISLDSMRIACDLVDYHMQTSISLFSEFEYTESGRSSRKVINKLKKNMDTGFTAAMIANHTRMSQEELMRVMKPMIDSGSVQTWESPNKKVFYRLAVLELEERGEIGS